MKHIYVWFLISSLLFLIGCSTPNTGKTLEEIQKSTNQGIDKGSQWAKNLANKAIDLGTENMQWAKKEVAIAAGEKTKEILNEKIDQGNAGLKSFTSGAATTISDTVNKANDSVKKWIDTAKEQANKVIDTAKSTTDQAKTVVVWGYTIYSKLAVDAALKAGKKVVLFFHATWCPTCKVLDGDILANRTKIPSDTVIFKVDYDLNTPLKATYGVTTQHTLVYLNSDATKKSLTTKSSTLDEVLKGR